MHDGPHGKKRRAHRYIIYLDVQFINTKRVVKIGPLFWPVVPVGGKIRRVKRYFPPNEHNNWLKYAYYVHKNC